MSCKVSADNAERAPPAQHRMNSRSSRNSCLVYGESGEAQNSSMPRGVCMDPGIAPSRCSSRTSRMSTINAPSSVTRRCASAGEMLSIRLFASATISFTDLTPIGSSWGFARRRLDDAGPRSLTDHASAVHCTAPRRRIGPSGRSSLAHLGSVPERLGLPSGRFSLGIDTGGTFTDAVICSHDSGAVVATAKTPTRHGDLFGCVVEAMTQVHDARRRRQRIRHRPRVACRPLWPQTLSWKVLDGLRRWYRSDSMLSISPGPALRTAGADRS